MTQVRLLSSAATAVIISIGSNVPASAATCEALASETFPHVKITSVQVVAAGAFRQPGGGRQNVPPIRPRGPITLGSAGFGLGYNGGKRNARYEELPAFCQVTATLTPTTTSEIRAELWLPMTGWNGKFIGTSPNGMGGNIPYGSMANALREGYAVVGEDTGHRGNETNW